MCTSLSKVIGNGLITDGVVALGLQVISISDIIVCHMVCCAQFIFDSYDVFLDLSKVTNSGLNL